MKKAEFFGGVAGIVLSVVLAIAGSFGLVAYEHHLKEVDLNSSFSSASGADLQFPQYQPVVKSGSIALYHNFVMSLPITPKNIVAYSYRVKATGKLATGQLIVKASATNFGYDETRVHSVYFYIDDGRTGGHLGATRRNSKITEGGFTLKESPIERTFDLTGVPVAYGSDGQQTLRVLQTLNDNQQHWIGAFVSTGIFGSLDLLEIRYTCEQESNCSIDLVK